MRNLPLAIALCLWSSAAAAAPDCRKDERVYRPGPPTIAATPVALAIAGFDRDGDLRVTRAEYDGQVKSSFARGDKDGNGLISLIELSAWAEATLGNAGALPGPFDFDKDGDDKVSGVEFAAEFSTRFAALDKDKDEILLRSELLMLVDTPFRDRRGRNRCEPSQKESRAPGQ